MEVGWAALLVRVAFVYCLIDCSDGAASGLTWWTGSLLRSAWTADDGVVDVYVIVVVLIELNRLAWAFAIMHGIERWLSILPRSAWHHGIRVLGIEPTTDAGLQHLIPRVLLLAIGLLIDDILLELGLLLLMVASLLQWYLLYVHLLLHSATLAYNRCLIRVQSRVFLMRNIGGLYNHSCNVWSILKDIVICMTSNYWFSAGILWLLGFWIDA